MSTHDDHGWAKVSIEEDYNNRYQANAPLVVWCGRCKKLLPADEEWARLAAEGNENQERILLAKITKWQGKRVRILGAGHDTRGRIALRFEEIVENKPKSIWKRFWTK